MGSSSVAKPAGWFDWFVTAFVRLRLRVRARSRSGNFHDAENRQHPCRMRHIEQRPRKKHLPFDYVFRVRIWGHRSTPLGMKEDSKDVSSELGNGVNGCTSWMKRPELYCSRRVRI
ncbi:hypothetical protein TNCV_1110921 [Trichonephila clavipes]|nr:hypothetical protein TNCV_1110921 [Trichonephila clavipes]